jgi:hypothetical protein
MEDEYLDPEEKMWGIVFLYIAAALMAVGLVIGLFVGRWFM